MRHNISVSLIRLSILAVALWCSALTASAQTTAFSYQGQLNDGGSPANASYDMQFKLFDALTGGMQVGSTIPLTNVTVSNGIFTVTLDFGALAFPGANRWLEISVRLAGAGTYTTLTPRQAMTSTPYAIKSLSAATADGLSAVCTGCVSGAQIGSLPTDSGNYIQNTTTQQAGSNFNISGNGLIGGNVGIGTPLGTLPATKLDTAGTIRSTAQTVPTSGEGLEVIYTAGQGYLTSFNRSGSAYKPLNLDGSNLFLNTNSGGNVGIGLGLTQALRKLHVVDATSNLLFGNEAGSAVMRLLNLNSAQSGISALILGNSAREWHQRVDGAGPLNGSYSIYDNTASAYRLIIDSFGKVGIGGSVPGATLDVRTSTDFKTFRQISSHSFGTWQELWNQSSGGRNWQFISTGFASSEGAGKLLFRDDTAQAVRMLINTEGQVGIGIGIPIGKLDVSTDTQGTAIRGETFVGLGNGVVGVANVNSGWGIWGVSSASNGLAGKFSGNVSITGNLSWNTGSFKIDHPLDPANKYLSHSMVESPDMMNIYNGNVTTNAEGEATVTLPDYFEVLNRDFRYQLTVIGQFAQAIVASKINGNSFKIRTDKPNVEVSWQVTGVRRDAYANKHRIQAEEAKPERERGSYLHPEVFGQPEEKGVEWALRPEMMRKMKEQREKSQQANQSQQR